MNSMDQATIIGTIGEAAGFTKNKRVIQRFSRQAGLSYQDSKGKVMPAKCFQFKECSCAYNCGENLDLQTRENIFHRFWALANWNAQTAFLKASVREVGFAF